MISFIVAMDKNNVIGFNNKMPWHLPNDLKFFKETTTGHTIIMGRKTFESIGRVLPNRKHIVLSQGNVNLPKEVEIINDIDQIIELNKQNIDEEFFVIGGGNIFKQLLPYADRLYVTLIDESFKGDVFFPEISLKQWKEISKVKGERNESNPYDYYFIEYVRNNSI
ncbi:dihydrofolate reductase [Pseudogracilibacillus sp. SE30717A]|uniref:dihydrofolate reductase n=1 Tax=Pseudogracilibacillus sp. SE30717A TaxID=3098293 RepID=UPI00300DD70B